MRFPSDDELMAGPNAFEDAGVEETDGPEGATAGPTDVEVPDSAESDVEEPDLEDADPEALAHVEEDLEGLRTLREEANAGVGLVLPDYPADFRAGFVTVVGRPNVGKSTLTNALVGQKVAITSMRPETTRHNVRGIVHRPDSQIVIVDTPGYHRPRTLLGKRLNEMVREALAQVDCVVFCLPADQRIGPGDQFIARELRDVRAPKIAVATKMDLVSRERLVRHLLDIDKLGEWAAIVPVSALEGTQVDDLNEVLVGLMPLSPPLYPEGDVTDESRDTLISEYIREAALEGVRDELPHSLAVQVEEIVEREPRPGQKAKPLLDVHVNIYVERNSQKAIIIGKRGSRLKEIGTRSRVEIERLLGRRVFLDLHVRTAKDWQSDPKMLGRL
ncbi:MAG: GTPase Era, partial [Pauljensenia sp.]